MSEHDSTGTDDLDATFDRLVEDVGTHAHARGADAAVRAASRRRTIGGAGALVVVVLVVMGGLGGWFTRETGTGVPVVGGPTASATGPAPSSSAPPVDPDQVPAALSLERLNEASSGWTTWEQPARDVADAPPCLREDLAQSTALRWETEHFRSRTAGLASFQRSRFASVTDSNLAMRATVQAFEDCPTSGDSYFSAAGDGLDVVSYSWGSGGRRGVVWLINFGDRMDLLYVTGAPVVPEEARDRVVRLVATDVQVP